MARMSEDAVYDQAFGSTKHKKGILQEVGVRLTRGGADALANDWRSQRKDVTVQVFHRRVKADMVSQPVFLVVVRSKVTA